MKILELLYEADRVFTIGFFNPGKTERRGVLFQKKGLPDGSIEKKIVEKTGRFSKSSMFKDR